MDTQEILVKLQTVMQELFDLEPEQVVFESRLGDDLDLDSIDAIDLIIKMQELSGEKIDQEAMRKVRTVGDIVEIIDSIVNSRG